jgi:hypothetical protein
MIDPARIVHDDGVEPSAAARLPVDAPVLLALLAFFPPTASSSSVGNGLAHRVVWL